MKLNESIKTGVVKHNGKTYDVYQVIRLNDENGELFTQSSIRERGQKDKKYSKKLLESLESIGTKAIASLELFAAVKETNPSEQTMLLLTSSLNESLHSMCLDYIAEIDSYNNKQAKLANPYLYNVTSKELEVFTEI